MIRLVVSVFFMLSRLHASDEHKKVHDLVQGQNESTATVRLPINASPYSDESFIRKRRQEKTAEGILYRELMRNYDKNTRPVMNATDIVVISLNFTFSQVLHLNEKDQALSVILWMDHRWHDEKLIWNPADFQNIVQLKLSAHDVWLPDIVLYNTAEETIASSAQTQSRVFVRHNGDVFWPPVVSFTSSCSIDITYFPFDDQICFLKLGSWAYDGFQVDIRNEHSKMDLTYTRNNSEFELVDTRVERIVTIYDCCIEPFIDIKVYLHIRRQTIHHVFNIVIPCVVLSIICMMGFILPPNRNEEKISLQLSVVFSLSLFMLLVSESTPKTSEAVPLLGVYLTALMSITAMSTTVHLFCDKLLSSAAVRNDLPYLCNKFLYQLLICCKSTNQKCELDKKRDEADKNDHIIKNHLEMESNNQNTDISIANGKVRNVQSSNSVTRTGDSPHAELMRCQEKITQQSDIWDAELRTVFHHLQLRQDKFNSDQLDLSKHYQVAAKLDRFFFWGYLLSVTILTLYAFWLKPMQKKIQV